MSNTSCDSTLLLIRGFDIFEHISDEEYEELNLVHNFLEAEKGEYIYFPSQNHRKLYFTKKGFIKIGYIDENGNECIKEVIQKGEVFGQITLEKNNLQDEFAQAYKADVSLCAFNIEDFMLLLQKKPGMALAFSNHLGKKVRKIETRLLNLLNKSVHSRLINLLIQLIPEGETGLAPAPLHFPSACPVVPRQATQRQPGSSQQLAHPQRTVTGTGNWPGDRHRRGASAQLHADVLRCPHHRCG